MAEHHHHDHADDDPYYLDQMCMVALSAVFGAVCLSLYFWRTDILKAMLAPNFFPFVLGSGIALIILAVLRGVSLWNLVGKTPEHDHHHDHDHAHDHDHGHDHPPATSLGSLPLVTPVVETGVKPAPMIMLPTVAGKAEACEHDQCGHDHSHDHGPGHHHHHHHDHGHAHGHAHADHDHNWAPWRYVLLLVPVILFCLGIPVDTPPLKAAETKDADPWDIVYDFKRIFPNETSQGTDALTFHNEKGPMLTASWIALGDMPLTQASVLLAGGPERGRGPGEPISFQTLEGSANDAGMREWGRGRRVTVKGQFVNDPRTDRRFSLGRFRINCCRQDAVQLQVTILCSEGVSYPPNTWVAVTGEIQYRKDGDSYLTVLKVGSKEDVIETPPDSNPYIN